MVISKNIGQIKQEAKRLLRSNPRTAIILGIAPTIVIVFLFYLFATLTTRWLAGAQVGNDYNQMYQQMQSLLIQNPQYQIYTLEALLAYALVATGVRFSMLTWVRAHQLDHPFADSLQVFTGTYFFRVIVLWLSIFVVTEVGFSWFYVFIFYLTYGLRMTTFILHDLMTRQQPIKGWPTFKTLGFSWQLMRGHKLQLFLLDCSFLGWDLFNLLTYGCLSLYVIPYKSLSYAIFYQELIDQQAQNILN